MKILLSRIWAGWKRFGRILGAVQAEIILFLFYFLVFTLCGLIMRLFGFDSLRIRKKHQSNWQKTNLGQFDEKKATHQS
jgi:hypothetical protein